MKLTHLFLLATAILIVSSCAPGETVTDREANNTENSNPYPEWYNTELQEEPDSFKAYATVIASNSNEARSEAVKMAKINLQAAMSEKLEMARKKVVDETGAKPELDQPEFILALRKSEDLIAESAEMTNSDVQKVDKFSSYRGFAEVTISKSDLINRLTEAFPGNDDLWQAFTKSRAFQEL